MIGLGPFSSPPDSKEMEQKEKQSKDNADDFGIPQASEVNMPMTTTEPSTEPTGRTANLEKAEKGDDNDAATSAVEKTADVGSSSGLHISKHGEGMTATASQHRTNQDTGKKSRDTDPYHVTRLCRWKASFFSPERLEN